jgi:AcrR family transcriptional regulator
MSKSHSREGPDVRRASLIAATARVLARRGVAGASVRAIAGEAGVTHGLLGHYFGGVDALVAETYRHIDALVTAAVGAAVDAAGDDPRARLEAYVAATFRPPIADADLLATWIAFWGLVPADPAIAALHAQSYADYRARLAELLEACGIPAERAGALAIGLTALVDGLWLELCLSAGEVFTAGEALAIALSHLDALLRAGAISATGR